jgi:hypothetical protein
MLFGRSNTQTISLQQNQIVVVKSYVSCPGDAHASRHEGQVAAAARVGFPLDLVRNDERVRRFVPEAKSASSLNHPLRATASRLGSCRSRTRFLIPGRRRRQR